MLLGGDGGKVRVEATAADTSETTAPTETTTTTSVVAAPATAPTAVDNTVQKERGTTTTRPAPTTTTMAPAPHTCMLIRGQAAGMAGGTPETSASYPGRWDRRSTITVTNPIDQPVTLKGVWIASGNTISDGRNILERVFDTVGIRLDAGESVTVESVVEGYEQEPYPVVGLAAVEFAPASAPELNCIADHPRFVANPPYIRDNTGYNVPTAPDVQCGKFTGLPSTAPDGRAMFRFTTQRWFPGLSVRYQVNLRDGISEFTLGFPRNQLAVTGYVNWGDLATPHTMSVVSVDWDGGQKVC